MARSLLKNGCVPADPPLRPPIKCEQYKPLSNTAERQFRRALTSGPLELVNVRRAAGRSFRPIMKYFERKLRRELFPADFLSATMTVIGEIVPNAFLRAPIGTQIGLTLVVVGRRPKRHCLFMVSNFLDPEQAAGFPCPAELLSPDLDPLATHGRGLGIARLLASALSVIWSPHYEATVYAHFEEVSPARPGP